MNRYEILLDKPFVIENKPIIEDKKICPDCSHETPYYCTYTKSCPNKGVTESWRCKDHFVGCPYQRSSL